VRGLFTSGVCTCVWQKHYELLLFPDERHSPRSLKVSLVLGGVYLCVCMWATRCFETERSCPMNLADRCDIADSQMSSTGSHLHGAAHTLLYPTHARCREIRSAAHTRLWSRRCGWAWSQQLRPATPVCGLLDPERESTHASAQGWCEGDRGHRHSQSERARGRGSRAWAASRVVWLL